MKGERRTCLSSREGDAFALPLAKEEWGSFDLVHTRFLLEHVPDPLAVVTNIVRAARPGGRIVLEDDDHDVLRLWPEPAGFYQLWGAYMRTYDRLGNDPYVGRRLVSLLHQAGALPVRNTLLFFGNCSGSPTLELSVDNMVGLFIGAQEAMLSGGLLEEDTFRDAIEALKEWKFRPNAGMWYGIAWAEGIRPA